MTWRAPWEKISHSTTSTVVVIVLGEVLVGLLIFHAGVAYGERNAFDRMNGTQESPPPFGFGFLPHGFIPEGHGAVGTITAVTLPTFTLEERDGDEEVVRVSSSTNIRADVGTDTTLQIGDAVVVIGEPNSDSEQMNAQLIHIVPPAPPHQ